MRINLCKEIVKWQEEEDIIVLLIDANKNIDNGEFANELQAKGLKEAILEKYKDLQGLVLTYQLGLVPINSIFINESLNISVGGYLLFRITPSDHRVLQIKK